MSNYFNSILENKIKNSVKSDYIPNNLSFPKNSYQQVFSALIAKKASLRDSYQDTKEISSMLTMDIDIYDDENLYDPSEYPNFVKISAEMGNLIYDTLKGKTITDAEGNPYEFYDCAPTIIGLRTQSIANSIDDYFLLYIADDQQWIINNVLKSKGYYRQPEIPSDPAGSYEEVLNQILYFSEITPEYNTIQEILAFDLLHKAEISVSDTIFSLAFELYHGEPPISPIPDGEVKQLLDNYFYVARSSWIDSHQETGVLMNLFDLARIVLCSADLNECILDTVDDITQGTFSLSSFAAKWANSSLHGVITFYNGVVNAFSKGGLLAVGSYILSYFSSFDPLKSDDEGYICLTDNSEYIPKEYIVGVVSTIVGTIGQLAGVIISMISVPIGMAVSAASTLLLTIPKYVNYSYENETTASLLDLDDMMCLPYAPVATWQKTYDRDDLLALLEGDELYDPVLNIDKQSPALLFNVPGGCLIIGRKDAENFAVEFHPGFVDALVNTDSYDTDVIVYHDQYDPQYHPYSKDLALKIKTGTIISPQVIYFNYCNGKVIDIINEALSEQSESANNPVLSANDDLALRKILIKNCFLFKLWIGLLGEQRRGLSGQITFDHDTYIPMGLSFHDNLSQPDTDVNPWEEYGINADESLLPLLLYFLPNSDCHYEPSWDTLIATLDNKTASNLFQDVVTNPNTGYAVITHLNNNLLSWDYDNDDNTVRLEKVYDLDPDTTDINILSYIFRGGHYLGDNTILDFQFTWGFNCPKYNRNTFVLWTALTIAAVAVTTIAATVITLKVKKWRKYKRMSNEASVEAAWEQLKQNPSTENLLAYDKARKKNNRWAALTGGTKYSADGFWSQGGDGVDSASTRLNSIGINDTPNTNTDDLVKLVIKLISGQDV